MKRVGILALVGLTVLGAATLAPAQQMISTMNSARVLAPGASMAGGYFGVFDGGISVYGQYRYGFSLPFEGGLQFGFVDFDGDGNSGVILGGDGQFQIIDAKLHDPFDLSAGGLVQFAFVGDLNIFSLGGSMAISKDLPLRSGRSFTPYGRLQLRMDRADVSVNTPFGRISGSNTDFNVAFNIGGDLEIANNTDLVSELQLADNVGFLIGFNVHF